MVPHGHPCDRIIVLVCCERNMFQEQGSGAKRIALLGLTLRIVP